MSEETKSNAMQPETAAPSAPESVAFGEYQIPVRDWRGQLTYDCPVLLGDGSTCGYDTYDLQVMRAHITGTHYYTPPDPNAAVPTSGQGNPPQEAGAPVEIPRLKIGPHEIESFVWRGQVQHKCPLKWEDGSPCGFDSYDPNVLVEHMKGPHNRTGSHQPPEYKISPLLNAKGQPIVTSVGPNQSAVAPEFQNLQFKK